MTNYRLFIEWCGLLIATLLLVLTAWHQEWTQKLDATWLDFASEMIPSAFSEDIVVVAIDDRSLAEAGNWPWDRSKHADLVNALSQSEPRLIAFDILFLEPLSEEGDRQLAEAIAQAGNVVLPFTFGAAPGTLADSQPILPYAPFAAGAAGTGHVAVFPDSDGVVRRFALSYEASGESYDHMAREVYRLAGGSAADTLDGLVPMQPSNDFRTISAADILNQSVSPEFLSDKIILIGATAQGLGDRYAVSAYGGRLMPGVEIQANLLNAMMKDQLVSVVSQGLVAAVLVVALLLLFVAFWRASPTQTLRISLALIAGLAAISLLLVVLARTWLPVFPAIIGILLAYPVWGWRRLSSVSRYLEKEAVSLTGLVPSSQESAQNFGFDTVARQVSQVKGLIGETRERLAFLRRTLASSPDAILVFDEKEAMVLMNQRAQDLFGEEAKQTGRSLSNIVSSVEGQWVQNRDELEFPDGRVFLVASSKIEMIEGYEIVSLRDITAIRENERQRQETLEFLSHDMRSPQAAIVGLAGSMGKSLPTEERFARIAKQARRTLKLADDFVQIARLEHNGVDPQDSDLCAQLHEAIDRAYTAAKRKGITLDLDIPEDPEFCLIEPSSMARAIDNLIDNAIKFSPPEGRVKVSLKRTAQNALQIEVQDQGPGLPEERRKNTFARFGARQSGAGPSAGLGLAYVKRVVDEHKGEISAQSSPGQGTRFSIILPA